MAGPAMHPWVADVSDLAEVTAAMNGVTERFGRLDVLVNNAGGELVRPGFSNDAIVPGQPDGLDD